MRKPYLEILLYVCNRLVAVVPSHLLRLLFYRRLMKMEIGRDTYIFMDAWFDTKGNFRIGNNSVINQKCRLDNRGGIRIGDNVSISAEVTILTADHNVDSALCEGRVRGVTIGDYVFIGTRAMLLPGVRVGEGAVIAAGAIVTRDVEDYLIVAGVPARPIRKRPRGLKYTVKYDRWLF